MPKHPVIEINGLKYVHESDIADGLFMRPTTPHGHYFKLKGCAYFVRTAGNVLEWCLANNDRPMWGGAIIAHGEIWHNYRNPYESYSQSVDTAATAWQSIESLPSTSKQRVKRLLVA